jgi:hypothetical protein
MSARDVEVLREWWSVLAKAVPTSCALTSARHAALSAAISALGREERRDARRALGPPPAIEDVETCPLCHQPQALHPGGVYCPLPPSEDSKAERIRSLEAVIRLECDNARVYIAQGTPSAVLGPLGRMERAVDPHKSWCRDPEHEGACVPESIDEVLAASEDEP